MAEAAVKRLGKNLTEGPIFPMLISFAIPMVLTNLVQQLYSMADLMIIGKFVGSVGTVGVSTGGELTDLMAMTANGLAIGGQIYVAQLVGAKNQKKLESAVSTFLTMMMIFALVATAGALIFHRQFLAMLRCPDDALSAATAYMLITAIGIPFIFGYNAICAMLRGMGESKRPLLFVSIAATVNIFLDLLLVTVIPLGAAGTAIATVASQIGAFIASFIYLYRRRESIGFRLKLSYFRMNRVDLLILIRLGIPQLVRAFCVQGSMLWVKSNVNSFGMTVSATYSIGGKIEKFINIFIISIDGAGGAMMGQNIGAGKLDRVREIMRKMLLVTLLIGVLGAVLFLTVPDLLFAAFTDDPAVIEYGRVFLRIMSVGCIVVGFSSAMKSISTGSGAALLSLILGILDGVCRVGACLFFYYVLKQGPQSYFWGAALCMLIPGLTAMWYYLSGKWKTKTLLSER